MVSLFSRLNYKIKSISKEQYGIIPIEGVMKGQQLQEISYTNDEDFTNKCLNNSKKCEKYQKKFFWAQVVLKVITTSVLALTGILGGLLGWRIGMTIGIIFGTLSVTSFFYGWPELREKYSILKLEFIKLSSSFDPNRDQIFLNLELKMNTPSLASDL
jgi:hypothetical protein